MITQTGRVLNAFPALPDEFVDILLERAKAKGFSDERLKEAVNHVIDNCPYPTPTLANFLSFDKRVKVLSYDELCDLVTSHIATFESYTKIIINGKRFWIRKADKELYNLPEEI